MVSSSWVILGVVALAGIAAAEENWLGVWESIEGRQEHFKEFVKEILGHELTDEQANAQVIHEISKEGDHYKHKISVPAKNYHNDFEFKLNEEGKHSVNGTEFKYKYQVEGNKLKGDISIPSKNKQIHEESEVKGEELEKSYKVGSVHAKRWFKKKAQ